MREIANLRGSRGTLLEHSPAADSQSNGFIERGIRSVEEMTRVILFDFSSRIGCPLSVHSPVFPWIVEHATDILDKCHVASDGKSTYERLKRRQHREMLFLFGTAVMFGVAGKGPGGVMAERWRLGTCLGKRFRTLEHIVARRGESCDRGTSGVLRDVLPDVPRQILSRGAC